MLHCCRLTKSFFIKNQERHEEWEGKGGGGGWGHVAAPEALLISPDTLQQGHKMCVAALQHLKEAAATTNESENK